MNFRICSKKLLPVSSSQLLVMSYKMESVPVNPTDVSRIWCHKIDKLKQKRKILQFLWGLSLSFHSSYS